MRDKKINYFIIGVIIILIILGGFLYFASKNKIFDKDTFIFEDEYPVKKVGDFFYLQGYIGPNEDPFYIGLTTDPRTIKDIPSDSTLRDALLYNAKFVYVVMEPNMGAKAVKIFSNIQNVIQPFFGITTKAVIENKTGTDTLLINTCNNYNHFQKIILLKIGDETKMYSINNCIILEGETEQDLVRASEKLTLQLFGVLKE